jgi:DNA-binding NtrC family response regulator
MQVPALLPDARALLERHGWPGNIRELRNAVERACLLARGAPIGAEHLGLDQPTLDDIQMSADPAGSKPGGAQLRGEIEALERERILEALEATGGNQTRAAAMLGISRRTLVNRLEAYGLPRPRKGSEPSGSS